VIAVFVNPRSRANRRNPEIAAEFQAILGNTGRVFAPRSLEELAQMSGDLHQSRPEAIAVHGGDGTLHKTVTALVRAFGTEPLPPIAALCGGTMNVVASSLGIRERPLAFVQQLADAARSGQPPETLRRRCIQVDTQYGFIFGNGLMANFLNEYYAPGGYGPGRAVWLLLRLLGSAVIVGPFMRRVFHRFRGVVKVDGVPISWPDFVTIGAATVREVGLGFKLIHRADDDPERFGVIAIHAGPLALIPDFVAVHAGRGVAPSRAYSAVASTLDIEPVEDVMAYTIDGDLYRKDRVSGPLRISIGPAIDFIKPQRGLIRVGSNDTMVRP
jgi:diacylglycerol kinase family enzyme